MSRSWPPQRDEAANDARDAEARENVRQFINERLGEFLEAMADNVLGIRHLMMRDPKIGKFERITGDTKQTDKALKTKTAFWIYTKDPKVQAFTDLFNGCIDKPSEHVEIGGADGGPIVIHWQREDDEPKPSIFLRTKCFGTSPMGASCWPGAAASSLRCAYAV